MCPILPLPHLLMHMLYITDPNIGGVTDDGDGGGGFGIGKYISSG